jgi:ketosteroid isomerase-like protein
MMDSNTPSHLDSITRDTVERFIRAFQQKDASAIADLVSENCVMEAMQPHQTESGLKDTKPTFNSGKRWSLTQVRHSKWRTSLSAANGQSIAGGIVLVTGPKIRYEELTLLQVRDGKIAQALGYAKIQPRTTPARLRLRPTSMSLSAELDG